MTGVMTLEVLNEKTGHKVLIDKETMIPSDP